MKVSILILSTLAVISAIKFGRRLPNSRIWSERFLNPDSGDDNILGAFETPLNHFSPVDHRRIRLGYAMNVEFFRVGGPVFFYIHFTDTSIMALHRAGLVYDLARELNGAVVSSTARFLSEE